MTNTEIRNWVIYKIINPEGRIYVGRTCRYKSRISNYKRTLEPRQTILHASFIKHGFDSHAFTIIDEFSATMPEANAKEIFWIRTYMSNYNQFPEMNGMNCTIGGNGLGRISSKETKEKIGNWHRGKKLSQEQIEFMRKWNKENPTKAMLGRNHSDESKKKMSEARKGKPSPHKGKKVRPEVVAAMSLRMKGKGLKPIEQYDLDGNFVAEYPSAKEASEAVGIHYGTVGDLAGGRYKAKKSNYKFIFKFKQPCTQEIFQ